MTQAAGTRAATFLMTDIAGSTRMWEQEREAMVIALASHDALLRTAVEAAGGRVASRAGRDVDAQRWFREAIPQYEAIGDDRFVFSAQSELAHALRRSGDMEAADAVYRKTIRGWQRTGNRGAVANQLESLAFTALALGDPSRAARLLGATEALREAAGDAMTPHERMEYDAEVGRLRATLDAAVLDHTWADGRNLTEADAVGLAVAV